MLRHPLPRPPAGPGVAATTSHGGPSALGHPPQGQPQPQAQATSTQPKGIVLGLQLLRALAAVDAQASSAGAPAIGVDEV